MPLYAPIMPTRYAAPVLDLVREQKPGLIAEILQASEIDASAIDDRRLPLTMLQFSRLLTAAAGALERSDLGFELGSRIGIEDHAPLSLALRSCATTHELLTMLARYWRLITTCFSIDYRRDAKGAALSFRPAAGMSRATLYTMEEVFAVSFHADYAKLLRRPPVCDIYLSMERPKHAGRYAALRAARFHFAAHALPEVRCVLPLGALDQPLDRARLNATRGRARSDPPPPAAPFAPTAHCGEWVKLMLREAEGTQPSRQILAELLGVSRRTLTRNLAADGINLRCLNNEIRYDRARAMLCNLRQPITQIAFRLGYRDVTSFNHAFRAMSGMSPRAFRRRANPRPARVFHDGVARSR